MMHRTGPNARMVLALIIVSIMVLSASCSAQPDEASAREAVEQMRGSEFMSSGSVNRFGIDTVTVVSECAVVRIIELPDTYELSIFLQWDDGSWQGTHIITGHSAEIDQTATGCWRN
jgi:hypothetical protein